MKISLRKQNELVAHLLASLDEVAGLDDDLAQQAEEIKRPQYAPPLNGDSKAWRRASNAQRRPPPSSWFHASIADLSRVSSRRTWQRVLLALQEKFSVEALLSEFE